MELAERVGSRIKARALLQRGQQVLVSVSGGADSMVLLHVLHTLAEKNGWKLTIAHLNHQLRGRSSDADEHLVRKVALSLGLPIVIERADVRGFMKRENLSTEMAARQLRHSFLASTALRKRISTVALAHHADDQVELFFVRLFRGSSLDGLAGMKWKNPSPEDRRVTLIRPLLDESKSDLKVYAASNKIPFREDATNASHAMPRNRIRGELLPLLRAGYHPFSDATILRLMDMFRAEADYLKETASTWLRAHKTKTARTAKHTFAKLPVALQRRCLQLQLIELNIVPNFDLVEELRLKPGRGINVVSRAGKSLRPTCVFRTPEGKLDLQKETLAEFDPMSKTIPLREGSGDAWFDGLKLQWQFAKKPKKSLVRKISSKIERFDADKVGNQVILRHWQPGDRFQPIGMATAVKLQDIFSNLKIPARKRHALAVATTVSGEIFWVEGIRISERFKLSPNTLRCLKWRWERA